MSMTRRTALFAAAFVPRVLFADPPPDVLKLIREAAEHLANDDPIGFLDEFDPNMAGYAELRRNVEALLGAHEVGSTIDVISEEGSETAWLLKLDWVLVANEKTALNGRAITRRNVVTCRVEKQGRNWRFTSFAPVDLFQP